MIIDTIFDIGDMVKHRRVDLGMGCLLAISTQVNVRGIAMGYWVEFPGIQGTKRYQLEDIEKVAVTPA